ncbi:MAG: hypothetical protein ACYDCF_04590, partial [Burkholderiales bacterium]
LSPLTESRGSERPLATGKGHDGGCIAGVTLVRETRTDMAWGRERGWQDHGDGIENGRGYRLNAWNQGV